MTTRPDVRGVAQSPWVWLGSSVLIACSPPSAVHRIELTEILVGPAASPTMAVAAVDFDLDGVLEVAVASGKHDNARNTLYRSSEWGTLDLVEPLGEEADRSFNIASGDLNGDGLPDYVVANETPSHNRVCLQVEGGAVRCEVWEDWETRDVDLADLDLDGDLDMVFSNKRQVDWLVYNDGSGAAARAEPLGHEDRQSVAAAVGDVNGDSYPDIAVASREDIPSAIHLGSALGAGEGVALDAWDTRQIELADLDGDGDLDAVIGNLGSPNTVILNDGFLGDADRPQQRAMVYCPDDRQTWTVAVADLDGDGLLDIVEGNVPALDGIHFGRPDGTFTAPQPLGAEPTDTRDIAIGDFDNDGDLDVVVGRFEEQDVLYLVD